MSGTLSNLCRSLASQEGLSRRSFLALTAGIVGIAAVETSIGIVSKNRNSTDPKTIDNPHEYIASLAERISADYGLDTAGLHVTYCSTPQELVKGMMEDDLSFPDISFDMSDPSQFDLFAELIGHEDSLGFNSLLTYIADDLGKGGPVTYYVVPRMFEKTKQDQFALASMYLIQGEQAVHGFLHGGKRYSIDDLSLSVMVNMMELYAADAVYHTHSKQKTYHELSDDLRSKVELSMLVSGLTLDVLGKLGLLKPNEHEISASMIDTMGETLKLLAGKHHLSIDLELLQPQKEKLFPWEKVPHYQVARPDKRFYIS